MNQMLPATIIDDLMSMLPVKEKPAMMTRAGKLRHWAAAVRQCHGPSLVIFHKLEYRTKQELAEVGYPLSAFHLAGADPVLQAQGIKQDMKYGKTPTTSAAEVMRFFELSQAQLHEFSCDCGGRISANHMADRIEGIARQA